MRFIEKSIWRKLFVICLFDANSFNAPLMRKRMEMLMTGLREKEKFLQWALGGKKWLIMKLIMDVPHYFSQIQIFWFSETKISSVPSWNYSSYYFFILIVSSLRRLFWHLNIKSARSNISPPWKDYLDENFGRKMKEFGLVKKFAFIKNKYVAVDCIF